MAEFSITIKGTSVQKQELSSSDHNLLLKAEQAASDAYAPYSQFNVGAALSLANGETVIGNNQENVSFPSGLCAERVAIFAASSKYPGVAINTMAITVKTNRFNFVDPPTPCGGCRQVIMEYQQKQNKPIRLILMGMGDTVWIFEDASAMLPFAFEADKLKH